MSRFSQRYGYTSVKSIQRESLDEDTRNNLWNVLYLCNENKLSIIVESVWIRFYKKTFDTIPQKNYTNDYSFIRKVIMQGEWFEILDLIEFLASIISKEFDYEHYCVNIAERLNLVFEKECCAYRFVNGQIVEITSEQEIKEIEKASNSEISQVNEHLKTALSHYSRKISPDYRNSIKESISAVEAICRKITGKDSLGNAIKKLESQGLKINNQLKTGLSNLYNYTNDKQGIRHAIMDEENVSQEDARFMLVVCSAFVNYLVEKTK